MTDKWRPNVRRREGTDAGSNRPSDRVEATSTDRGPLVPDGGLSVSECLKALADRRRRYVLYCLREKEHTEFESLSERVAAWETGTPLEELDERTKRNVGIALSHAHLPQLEDAGMIQYDYRQGTVRVVEVPAPIEKCLEYCWNIESPGEFGDR